MAASWLMPVLRSESPNVQPRAVQNRLPRGLGAPSDFQGFVERFGRPESGPSANARTTGEVRSRVVKSFLRKLWVVRGRVVLGLSLCLVVYLGWWLYAFTKQINNFIRLDQFSREVRRVRDDTGTLPIAFAGHKDFYGREVVYIHDEQHFMLLSFGSDGRPDGFDYMTILDVPVGKRRDNCLAPWRDTVMIDGWIWQGCAK